MLEFHFVTRRSIEDIQVAINGFLIKNPDWKRDGSLQTITQQDGNWVSCNFIQFFVKETFEEEE